MLAGVCWSRRRYDIGNGERQKESEMQEEEGKKALTRKEMKVAKLREAMQWRCAPVFMSCFLEFFPGCCT
jgi:hypothetical protein